MSDKSTSVRSSAPFIPSSVRPSPRGPRRPPSTLPGKIRISITSRHHGPANDLPGQVCSLPKNDSPGSPSLLNMKVHELARWTRFAAKGGIGKCTAVQDCVALSSDDLMFLKVRSLGVVLILNSVKVSNSLLKMYRETRSLFLCNCKISLTHIWSVSMLV